MLGTKIGCETLLGCSVRKSVTLNFHYFLAKPDNFFHHVSNFVSDKSFLLGLMESN